MSPALLALIQTLIQFAIVVGPELVKEGELALSLLQSPTDLTPEQQAEIDQALDAAHAKLQAALTPKA